MGLIKITDSSQFTEVYHLIQSTVECFMRVSVNCPKAVLQVVQNTYGRFDDSLFWVFKASNTMDMTEKVEFLQNAKSSVFFQFNSIEMLVKSHSLTIGQANEVLTLLKNSYEQLSKWFNSCVKQMSSER